MTVIITVMRMTDGQTNNCGSSQLEVVMLVLNVNRRRWVREVRGERSGWTGHNM